jgi:hypothetical protein
MAHWHQNICIVRTCVTDAGVWMISGAIHGSVPRSVATPGVAAATAATAAAADRQSASNPSVVPLAHWCRKICVNACNASDTQTSKTCHTRACYQQRKGISFHTYPPVTNVCCFCLLSPMSATLHTGVLSRIPTSRLALCKHKQQQQQWWYQHTFRHACPSACWHSAQQCTTDSSSSSSQLPSNVCCMHPIAFCTPTLKQKYTLLYALQLS